MSEGNLGLVGAGFGILSFVLVGAVVGPLIDDVNNIKAVNQDNIDLQRTIDTIQDARHDALQGRHEASQDFLIDRLIQHQKEIDQLKKRKRVVIHKHVHTFHSVAGCETPYDDPESH